MLLFRLALLGLLLPVAPSIAAQTEARPPNVVVVFTDDQGYGDLSCQGHPTIHTPHIDALAASGVKLSQFYVASPVCSPSRAALLTGCYPKRVGMHRHVVFPQNDYGLHPDEVTVADLLRTRGYATGCFGKWHLGHRRGLLPEDQGFDEYFGVPYSNDMAQQHRKEGNKYTYRLPLMRGDEVVEWEPDQRLLTKRYTDAAVSFIERHADQPFFVYVPHSMPHIPLYASDDFDGKSPRGLYGDVIEEIDWSVGQLVAALERTGTRDRTLFLFTSDNGPWLQFKQDGGSAGPLRGGKGTNWEGGQRVPAIVSWPGQLPAGDLCRTVLSTMDLLPTVARLAGAELPADRPIDGHDVWDTWSGDEDRMAPYDLFLYYTSRGELAGVRQGPWKYLLGPGELYHLEHDIGEQRNVAKRHPKVCEAMREAALARDAEITAAARPVLRVEETVFDPRK